MRSGGSDRSSLPKRYCRVPLLGAASFDAQTETILAPVRQEKTTVSAGVQNDVCFAPEGAAGGALAEDVPAGGAAGAAMIFAALTRATVRDFLQSGLPWHSSAITFCNL